ncbi:MAG: alpha/beta fold hydrolase BchO [Pseudomonadota bacterium]
MLQFLSKSPDWDTDGADWPHRDYSAFVETKAYRWHIQRMGSGPAILLIHGTGASTHSWGPLAAILAKQFEVVAFDLPGHGFTKTRLYQTPSLPKIAAAVGDLFSAIGIKPSLTVGHSAGAAIMIEMIRQNMIAPRAAVGINGALSPFDGAAGFIFPLAAKFLYYNPLTAYAFSRNASDTRRVANLIRQTGSSIDSDSIQRYATLMQSPSHVSGALGMMAHWNLSAMESNLLQLEIPTLFIAGALDKAVPPQQSKWAAELAPRGTHAQMEGVAHLAHEENPEHTAALITAFALESSIN